MIKAKEHTVIIAFISVIFIFFSFCIFVYTSMKPMKIAEMGTFGDSFGVLNCLFSGLGFCGLVFTIRSQQKQMSLQSEEHDKREVENKKLIAIQISQFDFQRNESDYQEKLSRSLFNLENATHAYTEAQTLLDDGNNDRVTWIRAARMLKIAKLLADDISIENHKNILEVRQMKIRQFFNNLLVSKDSAFFYGVKNTISLELASWKSIEGGTEHGINFSSNNRRIPETAIRAVWEAAQWPKNYSDPLFELFSEQEKKEIFVKYRKLSNFFEFDEKFKKQRRAQNHLD